MEALGVFALQMKSPPLHQVCMRCYRSLFRTGTISRALQTNVANRQMCTSETIKPVDQPLTGSRLSNRSLVLVKGRDASDLLQGLMTNDMQQLDEGKGQEVMYSMFLNKQGRVLYDVMCYQWSRDPDGTMQSYILECDSAISQELQKHLKIYRIRKKVDITLLDSEYDVWSIFSPSSTPPPSPGSESIQSRFFPDPRVQGLGQRVIVPQGSQVSDVNEVSQEDYMTHRYQWGVAEGVNELPPGDCLPLEANLALMNGVSFTKGCYLGQELTARTHHTGVIRKRVMPIHFTGNAAPTIPAGTSIKSEEGKNVGKLRCHLHQNGLALLRTALIGSKLKVTVEDGGEADLEASRPSWWPKDS